MFDALPYRQSHRSVQLLPLQVINRSYVKTQCLILVYNLYVCVCVCTYFGLEL